MEFSKGEAGLGQHEINLEYAEALEMADRHVIYKNAAKEIAGLHGRSLTFMAKYDMGGPGSSCHIHSSVWDADGDTPLMHDPAAPEGMSDVFRGWLGGSLALTQGLGSRPVAACWMRMWRKRKPAPRPSGGADR